MIREQLLFLTDLDYQANHNQDQSCQRGDRTLGEACTCDRHHQTGVDGMADDPIWTSPNNRVIFLECYPPAPEPTEMESRPAGQTKTDRHQSNAGPTDPGRTQQGSHQTAQTAGAKKD